jgi:anti-sigma28 factor (negative regulator of flagellin synthesis)
VVTRDPSASDAARQKEARLRELQRRIVAGTYRVAALEVADAILALHRNDQND